MKMIPSCNSLVGARWSRAAREGTTFIALVLLLQIPVSFRDLPILLLRTSLRAAYELELPSTRFFSPASGKGVALDPL